LTDNFIQKYNEYESSAFPVLIEKCLFYKEEKMHKYFKISNHFRKLLKQELITWDREGIVNTEQAQKITEKYRLDQLTRETTNTLLLAIYLIGSCLIAAGVISFVAAHWQSIPREIKVLLIVAFMLACHLSGFYLWKISGKSPRLGHALIVLGTLVFGANIGLLAQIFHIRANFYNGMYAWAIGALIMAYAIRSVPNAIVAIIVSFVGYCYWLFDFSSTFSYYPLVAFVLFLPLAFKERSRLILILSMIVIGFSMTASSISDAEEIFNPILTLSLTSAGVGLLFFAIGLLTGLSKKYTLFAVPSMIMACILIAITAYLTSFKGWFGSGFINRYSDIDFIVLWETWLVVLICIYIVSVAGLFFSIRKILSKRNLGVLTLSIIVAVALIVAGVIIQLYDEASFFITVIFANIAAFCLAAAFIGNAFITEDRRTFWAGILFTALLITSRFLEYETSLMIKAAVFTICGIALIAAGIKFESFLRKRKLIHE
jgi:uncharacterized membrane protein